MTAQVMIVDRYKKNMLIEGFGETGQNRLAESTVAVIGLGGLGGAVSLYLAAAGVGRLILCDFDTVEISNLQRQILYQESEPGRKDARRVRNFVRTATEASANLS